MAETQPAAVPAGAVAAMTASPDFPRDSAGPVFRAPWEAQAFALTLALHGRGKFTWTEWAQALAAVIAEVRQRGEPDTGEHYYRHWLTAPHRAFATGLRRHLTPSGGSVTVIDCNSRRP